MKVVTEKVVRTEEEASNTRVEGIRIGGIAENITVRLDNVATYSNDDGRLEINFFDKDNFIYKMRISKEGIMFERFMRRYDHDHDDIERLQVRLEGELKGEVMWLRGSTSGFDTYYVPFGAVKVNN